MYLQKFVLKINQFDTKIEKKTHIKKIIIKIHYKNE